MASRRRRARLAGGIDLHRNEYRNFNTALVDYCLRTGASCATVGDCNHG